MSNKKVIYIIISIIFIILISLVVINVINKDKTKETLSNENLYNDIENTVTSEETINYDTEKFYLHDSDLKLPKGNVCYNAQNKTLNNLSETDKIYVQDKIREIHHSLERTLLDGVRLLKDKNSPYWIRYIEEGAYEEPQNPNVIVDREGILTTFVDRTTEVYNIIQNEQVKEDLKQSINLFEEAIDEHNLGKLFEAHKIIHDYDYWVINYPPIEFQYAPPDCEGANTYF